MTQTSSQSRNAVRNAWAKEYLAVREIVRQALETLKRRGYFLEHYITDEGVQCIGASLEDSVGIVKPVGGEPAIIHPPDSWCDIQRISAHYIGTLHFAHPSKSASGRNWVLEMHGEIYRRELEGIVQQFARRHEVRIDMKLKYEEPQPYNIDVPLFKGL